MLEGKPIGVRKLDTYRVAFDLPAAVLRSRPPVRRHFHSAAPQTGSCLEAGQTRRRLAAFHAAFGDRRPGSLPAQGIRGGPAHHLERNPYYWKVDQAGAQLPYLNEVEFLFAGSEDNQVMRFQAGESDIISRVGARNFAVLEKDRERRGYDLVNAGGSLEYSFLFFNLGDLPAGSGRRKSQRTRPSCAARVSGRRFPPPSTAMPSSAWFIWARPYRWPARYRPATRRGSIPACPRPVRSVEKRAADSGCGRIQMEPRRRSSGSPGTAGGILHPDQQQQPRAAADGYADSGLT